MKEIVGEKNAMDLVRVVMHHITTALMVLTMILIIVPYIITYIEHLLKNYNYILARVTDQDSTVTNRVSSVSVIKYAIYNNKTTSNSSTTSSSTTTTTVSSSSNTETSYSDLTPYCLTNNVYLAPDKSTAGYMISGFWSGWFIFSDPFFIFCMFVILGFILFISCYPIKMH